MPTDEWIMSARQYIVAKECDCDCMICARGDHDTSGCPHPIEDVEIATCQSCGSYSDPTLYKTCPVVRNGVRCDGYLG